MLRAWQYYTLKSLLRGLTRGAKRYTTTFGAARSNLSRSVIVGECTPVLLYKQLTGHEGASIHLRSVYTSKLSTGEPSLHDLKHRPAVGTYACTYANTPVPGGLGAWGPRGLEAGLLKLSKLRLASSLLSMPPD